MNTTAQPKDTKFVQWLRVAANELSRALPGHTVADDKTRYHTPAERYESQIKRNRNLIARIRQDKITSVKELLVMAKGPRDETGEYPRANRYLVDACQMLGHCETVAGTGSGSFFMRAVQLAERSLENPMTFDQVQEANAIVADSLRGFIGGNKQADGL